MILHVVQAGQTMFSIAARYGLPVQLLAAFNGIRAPYALAVGQCLLVLTPARTVTVAPGDTLFSISRTYGTDVRALLRRNPQLGGSARLQPGQTLVLELQDPGTRPASVSGYAYPTADPAVLRGILPYAAYLAPFTYGISQNSTLVRPEDEGLLRLARQYGVRPLLHLSTLTEDGTFSTQRGADVLADREKQQALADSVIAAMTAQGYEGLDVDFEFVGGENAAAYAGFVGLLRSRVNALGLPLITALAPKVSPEQPGVLYEGHDYRALAENSDAVLLMTYEWGYTQQP